MANCLDANDNHKITWKQGSINNHGNIIGCLHLTLKDENHKDVAKACLTANQMAAYCLENNKLKIGDSNERI